ncbi:bifunctional 2-C-methyl-D-erythritol 4-phosphate cytidylyltransferase/2-C-methyl-D-erythritol 2,4-cyclodiphosphate synthase [Pacificimonas sp. WHA3]|uniref:Bifunctional enzyme IspD/IspF n=1 Tax=Pacificimonas pallii TaxID=2827236 RepID=A0ABS6SDL5_9SPHN|nr:bifunctional 2-C-methyl-D-erythritol 4-phosphate cytidylyltransferase/2-C-methyl-D-erythritol 2,4-cyclodiphosphate synthase [Pacificimonas pallii]MBV7256498.1 bifunctional 2-C-methyl-D-erythritol 4-phosphate cytidylyltransferase/2-C-methyl-D-erythritol 2,4-cyclodiphosphate synthase [Pacificimonas pallii]
MKTVALIVAAGSGLRAGEGLPKQYRSLGARAVLSHSVERLSAHPDVDEVRVVINPAHRDFYDTAIADVEPIGDPVDGADTRQGSVLAGLEAIGEADIVLIHDAARPFIGKDVVDRLIAALAGNGGAVPALPVVDSLRRGNGTISDEVSRVDLHRVQTPQAFRFAPLLAAHRHAAPGATDDAEIARAAGLAVALVAGDEGLFKLTHAQDFERAERLMGNRGFRTGFGYDVHRFAAGESVCLCGINVPHSRSLAGHSDADVGLHALTDALLGAIGAGDIGDHFPPGDPEWKGAASGRFLRHAADLVTASGGSIENVDVTLICEAPRIGPHRQAMRERVAEILRLPVDRVSVKATTTEKLGFTGRREGIAAQAVAAIRR